MKLKIAVLPGDGIGPEVTGSAVRVLKTLAELWYVVWTYRQRPKAIYATIAMTAVVGTLYLMYGTFPYLSIISVVLSASVAYRTASN